MKNIQYVCLLFCLGIFSVQSQIRPAKRLPSTSGIITDIKTGEPLIGSSIFVKGTNFTFYSKEKGMYKAFHRDIDTLIVSYKGFKDKKIPVNKNTKIVNIKLTSKKN